MIKSIDIRDEMNIEPDGAALTNQKNSQCLIANASLFEVRRIEVSQVYDFAYNSLISMDRIQSQTGLYFHLEWCCVCLWHGDCQLNYNSTFPKHIRKPTVRLSQLDDIEVYVIDSVNSSVAAGFHRIKRSAITALEDVHIDLLVLKSFVAKSQPPSSSTSNNQSKTNVRISTNTSTIKDHDKEGKVQFVLSKEVAQLVDLTLPLDCSSNCIEYWFERPSLDDKALQFFALLYAVLDFVYWDDNMQAQLNSYYVPPAFVMELLLNMNDCYQWMNHVDEFIGIDSNTRPKGNSNAMNAWNNTIQQQLIKIDYHACHSVRKQTYCSSSLAHLSSVCASHCEIFQRRQLYTLMMCVQQSGLGDCFQFPSICNDVQKSKSPEKIKNDSDKLKNPDIPVIDTDHVTIDSSSHWNSECIDLMRQLRDHFTDVLNDTDDESEEDDCVAMHTRLVDNEHVVHSPIVDAVDADCTSGVDQKQKDAIKSVSNSHSVPVPVSPSVTVNNSTSIHGNSTNNLIHSPVSSSHTRLRSSSVSGIGSAHQTPNRSPMRSAIKEKSKDPFNRLEFSRDCSRVGNCYQVTIPEMVEMIKDADSLSPASHSLAYSAQNGVVHASATAVRSRSSGNKSSVSILETLLDEPVVSRANVCPTSPTAHSHLALTAGNAAPASPTNVHHLSKQPLLIQEYLSKVHAIKHVVPGQIIEVPRNPNSIPPLSAVIKSTVAAASSASGISNNSAAISSPIRIHGQNSEHGNINTPILMATAVDLSPAPLRRSMLVRHLVTCVVIDSFELPMEGRYSTRGKRSYSITSASTGRGCSLRFDGDSVENNSSQASEISVDNVAQDSCRHLRTIWNELVLNPLLSDDKKQSNATHGTANGKTPSSVNNDKKSKLHTVTPDVDSTYVDDETDRLDYRNTAGSSNNNDYAKVYRRKSRDRTLDCVNTTDAHCIMKEFVHVTDGIDRWTVPLSSCRLANMPENLALEMLHRNNYDVSKSLHDIQVILHGSSGEQEQQHLHEKHGLPTPYRQLPALWLPAHFKMLKVNGDRFKDDPYGLFQYMQKCIEKQHTKQSSESLVQSPPGSVSNTVSNSASTKGNKPSPSSGSMASVTNEPSASPVIMSDIHVLFATVGYKPEASLDTNNGDDHVDSSVVNNVIKVSTKSSKNKKRTSAGTSAGATVGALTGQMSSTKEMIFIKYVDYMKRIEESISVCIPLDSVQVINHCPYTFSDVLDVYMRCFQSESDFDSSSVGGKYDTKFGSIITKQAPSSSAGKQTKLIMKRATVEAVVPTALSRKYANAIPPSPYIKTTVFNTTLLGVHAHQPSAMWPYSILPMAAHSIYWLKRNSCPCLCLGIDVSAYRSGVLNAHNASTGPAGYAAYIRIVPIDCATPRRMTLVPPTLLEPYQCNPLDVSALLRKCFGTGNETGGRSNGVAIDGSGGKSREFANAMVDFAVFKMQQRLFKEQWKMGSNPSDEGPSSQVPSPTAFDMIANPCKWFLFPEFIRLFLDDVQSWSQWRKQAERRVLFAPSSTTGVSLKLSSRELYCLAMLDSDCENNCIQRDSILSQAEAMGVCISQLQRTSVSTKAMDSDHSSMQAVTTVQSSTHSTVENTPVTLDRYVRSFDWGEQMYMLSEYPWEDDAFLFELEEIEDEQEECEELSLPATSKKKKRQNHSSADGNQEGNEGTSGRKLAKVEREITPPAPPPPPVIPVSPLNLYWVNLSRLPCLFYDEEAVEYSDKFTVLPINCVTFQYYTKVSRRQVEPLTLTNLRQCTDDKTREFALALMEFAYWDMVTNPITPDPESHPPNQPPLYQWPDFILELLVKPKEWSVWRKNACKANPSGATSVYLNSVVTNGTAMSVLNNTNALGSMFFVALKNDYEEICRLEEELEANEKKEELMDGTNSCDNESMSNI